MSHAQNIRNSIDTKAPPRGVRLELGSIAAALGVTITDMAEVASVTRAQMAGIVVDNSWPASADAVAIRAALCKLMTERGATDEQVLILFDARVSSRPRRYETGTDYHGNPPGYVPLLPHEARTRAVPRKPATPTTDLQETDMLLPKQVLRPIARKAFKVLFNPFDFEVTSEDQMYTSPEIAYVREVCMQAAIGSRFVAVVSESGGGKTTILSDLEGRIEREHKPVQFIRPWILGMEDSDTRGKTLKSADILASIITTLDHLATVPQSMQARSNTARDLLTQSVQSGRFNLVVIEEAHCLPDSTLKHLKRLHEMRLGMRPLLGILLVGQTELALRLDPRRVALREVTQRCEVVHLLPLDGDLNAYLTHRAKCVDRPLSDFIDASGVDEIRSRLTAKRPNTGGKAQSVSLLYPLAVNNIMTAALNAAAEIGAPVVNREVIRAV